MDTRTKNVSLEDLQQIVGAEHAREATPVDAVDGVEPTFVAEPGSVEETSELLRLASGGGVAGAPRGAGTRAVARNPPRGVDLVLGAGPREEGVGADPGDPGIPAPGGDRVVRENLRQNSMPAH